MHFLFDFLSFVMVHLYSLLENFRLPRGLLVTQKSFSCHVRGQQPSHMSLCSPWSTPGGDRTTSGTLQVWWITRPWFTQGSQTRKTSGPVSHESLFWGQGGPKQWLPLAMAWKPAPDFSRRVNKIPRNGGYWGIFRQFGAVLQNYLPVFLFLVKCFYHKPSPKHPN